MTALAISNSPAIHKKSPGRVTRFSADSARVWRFNHLNALNCSADGADCPVLRIMPSMMFKKTIFRSFFRQ